MTTSAPKMTRHEMKQDDLVTLIEKVSAYSQKNPATLRNAAIGVAIVLLGAAIITYWMSSGAAAARALLAQGQERFGAPVLSEGQPPPGSTLTYPTPGDRDRAALETFGQLVSNYGSRIEGRIGRYYQGILLARLGRNEEAESILTAFIADPSSPILAAVARAQLAQVLSQRGDFDGAAKIYTEMAESADGAYPRDWALFYLADSLQRQGKRTEAAAAFQRIVTEFPTSYFANEASRRSKGA